MSEDALARIEARLDRVEQTLERLAGVLDRVEPALTTATSMTSQFDDTLAMAADMADDWAKERLGGDGLEARLQASTDALVELTRPEGLDALVRIARQAPKLERAADLAASLDDTLAMGADVADEWIEENIGGDSLDARLQAGTTALLALSEPRILNALTRMAKQMPEFERLADLAASFDDTVAMFGDIADEWVQENIGGDGLDERLTIGLEALVQLTSTETLKSIVKLAELAPRLQRSAAVAARLDGFVDGMAKALEEPAPAVGIFGLIGALRDPEIQQGIGRALHMTKHLGRNEALLPLPTLEMK
jgi:uncharacterized protein YjgD (DUF1641 family)